jgi:hypothetical protein
MIKSFSSFSGNEFALEKATIPGKRLMKFFFLAVVALLPLAVSCQKQIINPAACKQYEKMAKRVQKSGNGTLADSLIILEQCCKLSFCTEVFQMVNEVSGAVVGAGNPGVFYNCMNYLMKNGNDSIFMNLAKSCTPAAIIMGVVCLMRSDSDKYKPLYDRFKDDSREVDYVPFGSVVTKVKMGDLIVKLVRDPAVLEPFRE